MREERGEFVEQQQCNDAQTILRRMLAPSPHLLNSVRYRNSSALILTFVCCVFVCRFEHAQKEDRDGFYHLLRSLSVLILVGVVTCER